ncbi:LANO_0C07536g1_1 [Lachancea nothofagi CBS 11611]|uniref:LANO_0C07536g1_1 n=1 Tax=Lachancea nothofagi CBS 11611 TaxID=1266666 RepID=A0A1G4J8N9_9SACH|nr:LANO_0C07536g1_1 [Lachancea nothofagi CBS 11611]
MLPTPNVSCDYDKVYEPSEDTFLLLDALEKDQSFLNGFLSSKVNVVCEIGCGSGIVTTFMMQNYIPSKYAIYIPTDVSPWAMESMVDTAGRNECDQRILSPVRMNLARSMRSQQIDLLVFNPPYVPAETVPELPQETEAPGNEVSGINGDWLDLALLGGDDGMVVTWQLLHSLHEFLAPNGVAYILFCARNKPLDVVKFMQLQGWKCELVKHRKAGWEVLSIYKFYR